MYFLIYVSSAIEPFSDQDLEDLLAISRRNNTKVGITGLLLYSQGNFMQVLEGPEKEVMETHDRIAQDPRHNGLITLMKGERDGRDFEDWSMGFKKIQVPDDLTIPGYSDFMNGPLAGSEFTGNSTRAMQLLTMFKKNMK